MLEHLAEVWHLLEKSCLRQKSRAVLWVQVPFNNACVVMALCAGLEKGVRLCRLSCFASIIKLHHQDLLKRRSQRSITDPLLR